MKFIKAMNQIQSQISSVRKDLEKIIQKKYYSRHHCDNCQIPDDWDMNEEFDCGDCSCHDHGG